MINTDFAYQQRHFPRVWWFLVFFALSSESKLPVGRKVMASGPW